MNVCVCVCVCMCVCGGVLCQDGKGVMDINGIFKIVIYTSSLPGFGR